GEVVTTRGQLHVQFGWAGLPNYDPSGRLSHLALRPAFDSSRLLHETEFEELTAWERAGFKYEYLAGFGLPHCKAWQCPLWFLCVIAGVLPAKAAHLIARRWRRKANGLCVFCGYDRRATSGVCPECGNEAVV